ncbi:MAG: insulinase family protein [Candidatus Brocadiaceae bacterium]|nr:insulinase family protein [Candidatus Brocadiaceae bacterium]
MISKNELGIDFPEEPLFGCIDFTKKDLDRMVNFTCRYFVNALFFLFILFTTFSAKSDVLQDKRKVVKLSNGIPYYHIQSKENISRYAIFIKAGHIYNNGNKGASHLVEHLFNLGGEGNNLSRVDEFLAKAVSLRHHSVTSRISDIT